MPGRGEAHQLLYRPRSAVEWFHNLISASFDQAKARFLKALSKMTNVKIYIDKCTDASADRKEITEADERYLFTLYHDKHLIPNKI